VSNRSHNQKPKPGDFPAAIMASADQFSGEDIAPVRNPTCSVRRFDIQALAGGDKPHSRQAKKIRSHFWRVDVMRLD
jgi:hypothetical protein